MPAILIFRPDAVLGHDPDLLPPGDVGHVARDRQAALQVAVLAVGADDARVDQLVQLALHLDHAGTHGLADLGRGQADAGGMAHRFGQVVEQLVQVLAEAVDGLALQAQPGVAEKDDGSDAHGRKYTESPPRVGASDARTRPARRPAIS